METQTIMTDSLKGKTSGLPAETEPRKNMYYGPMHHPEQLSTLGLCSFVFHAINKHGPLTKKTKQWYTQTVSLIGTIKHV